MSLDSGDLSTTSAIVRRRAVRRAGAVLQTLEAFDLVAPEPMKWQVRTVPYERQIAATLPLTASNRLSTASLCRPRRSSARSATTSPESQRPGLPTTADAP